MYERFFNSSLGIAKPFHHEWKWQLVQTHSVDGFSGWLKHEMDEKCESNLPWWVHPAWSSRTTQNHFTTNQPNEISAIIDCGQSPTKTKVSQKLWFLGTCIQISFVETTGDFTVAGQASDRKDTDMDDFCRLQLNLDIFASSDCQAWRLDHRRLIANRGDIVSAFAI